MRSAAFFTIFLFLFKNWGLWLPRSIMFIDLITELSIWIVRSIFLQCLRISTLLLETTHCMSIIIQSWSSPFSLLKRKYPHIVQNPSLDNSAKDPSLLDLNLFTDKKKFYHPVKGTCLFMLQLWIMNCLFEVLPNVWLKYNKLIYFWLKFVICLIYL